MVTAPQLGHVNLTDFSSDEILAPHEMQDDIPFSH
jgi:hypothetical protein